jgi:hypothetical protein
MLVNNQTNLNPQLMQMYQPYMMDPNLMMNMQFPMNMGMPMNTGIK